MLLRLCLIAGWLLLGVGNTLAAEPAAKAVADAWLPKGEYPGFVSTNRLSEADTGTLQVEALVGKLRVYWTPATNAEAKSVRLWISADNPGIWLARDWQVLPMEKKGVRWEGVIPVENVDVPMIYFIEVTAPKPGVTAQRICQPRVAGLEEPSRIFWPFLEGFEEELWSWRLVTDEPVFVPVETTGVAKSGNAALKLKLEAGKRSVTVATTRIRGWQMDQNFANGIRFWVKLADGTAKLRCTLQTKAFTAKQQIFIFPEDFTLTKDWQHIDLLLNKFPKINSGDVDLMTLEVIGNGPIEAYVDNVQLLGRWQPVD